MTGNARGALSCLLVAGLAAGALAPALGQTETGGTATPVLLVILDGSGSMWGQIEGENKIVIARRVLRDLVGGLPDAATVGLVAYGHRREGDCEDVETVVPMGPLDRDALIATVDGINPKGKTPITRSIEEAARVVAGRGAPVKVILVSDGLETCGGDPCAAVKAAREAGGELVFHVVGFDVAGEDVSSLECAAQAGGGLYYDAQNAEELASVLDQVVALPAEIPPGRLSVQGIADGELTDVAVRVTNEATGEEAAAGRTYTSPDTNPRVIPLEPGTYHVEVRAVGVRGEPVIAWPGVAIVEGEPVEKVADFSTGEIAVGVTRNGELGDAVVKVYAAGTDREVASNRSYTSASSNPVVMRLTAGTYDVWVGSVEISNKPEARMEGVVLEPGDRAERTHEFASGTLAVEVTRGGELADAVVYVAPAGGATVAQGRTYTSANSNPKVFELVPGPYEVQVRAVRGDREERSFEIEVVQADETSRSVDLAAGG